MKSKTSDDEHILALYERVERLEKRIAPDITAEKEPTDFGKYCGRCKTHVYSNRPINVCSNCKKRI